MPGDGGLPTEDTVHQLLDEIAPGSVLVAIGPLPGSYSNYTYLIEARSAEGSVLRLVLRRYAVFGHYDRGEKARCEFHTFELLQRRGIPAPRPLYLDEKGAILGSPGIVTEYVPGEQITAPADPAGWARTLATMLARIHAVPCDAATRAFLLDADVEASWFLRAESVPDYMAAHPEGAAVWHMARELWPERGDVAELGWVVVHPLHQGHGLGLQMCRAVLGFVRDLGHEYIYLLTEDFRLAAIKTYLRLGFVPEMVDASHPGRWQALRQAWGGING